MSKQPTCPHCKNGNPRKWRAATLEWVHDFAPLKDADGRVTSRFGHTICQDDPKWKAKQELKNV